MFLSDNFRFHMSIIIPAEFLSALTSLENDGTLVRS